MKRIAEEQKYSKTNLTIFKRLWSDASFKRISELDEEILKDTNENIQNYLQQ
jgi:hypothetical protein